LTRTRRRWSNSALWCRALRPSGTFALLEIQSNQMLQYGVPVAEMIAEKRAVRRRHR